MTKPNLIKATKKAIKDSPREIFNWYLFSCTCIWSFSGVAKGFDEGKFTKVPAYMSSSYGWLTKMKATLHPIVIMDVFKERFGLSHMTDDEYADTKGWIVSIATAGAVFGCMACIWLTQRLGRNLCFQFFTVVYIAGILGQTFSNGNLGALYATRVISGMGIGATTILPSVYIAEVRILSQRH